ncbi:MAG: hypothetical protein IIV67_07950 [Bacteroidaceae bacterium]|nr:hypothetical protein [Bacteroidaceae bacterium]
MKVKKYIWLPVAIFLVGLAFYVYYGVTYNSWMVNLPNLLIFVVTNAEARADYAIAQAATMQTNGNGDGCNRNNNIVQVNFSVFGTIRNWLGIGNKGGCEE